MAIVPKSFPSGNSSRLAEKEPAMVYKPEKIYIDADARDSEYCHRILSRYPDTEQIIIEDPESFRSHYLSTISITKGKRTLYLKDYKGKGFKLCPGFTENLLCCNYYVLDLIENCPLECTYCILQAFLNRPLITFHVNVKQIISSMKAELEQHPERHIRVGTGEHSDSLALDHVFRVNPYLVEEFSGISNATLELKTKTDLIEPLKGLRHNGNTVVAWSVNPQEIIKSNEFKTASLPKRINAASTLVDEGYRVAFHFDPVICYEGWEEGYSDTIDLLFQTVPKERIAWISLGTLRYIPILRQIARERFPGISIFSNEFITAKDGKMRYLKSLRRKMLRLIADRIYQKAPEVPLYLCMEKHSFWRKCMPRLFENPAELEAYLCEHLKD